MIRFDDKFDELIYKAKKAAIYATFKIYLVILFLDFHMGRILQLTGRSTIVWDISEEEKLRFPGAQRLVEFRMDF